MEKIAPKEPNRRPDLNFKDFLGDFASSGSDERRVFLNSCVKRKYMRCELHLKRVILRRKSLIGLEIEMIT